MLEDYERLTQAIPDTLLVTDSQGIIIWGNNRTAPLLGYEVMELIGAPIEKLVPANMRTGHVRLRDHFIHSPSGRAMGFTNEIYAENKSGARVPIEIELSPILWEGEDCILAAIRSRARYIEQERLYKETQDRLKRSQAIAHIGTWDWDIVKNELIWSDEIYSIFGQTPNEMEATYEGFIEFIHKDDQHIVMDAVKASIMSDKPYRVEHRICRPNGEILHVLELGKVYRDVQGNAVRMLGTVQDITEEKHLHLQQQLSETMFNHSYEGILIADSQFNIIGINPALARVTNFNTNALTNEPVSRLISEEQLKTHLRPILKNLRKHGHWQGELNCRKHNASPFPSLLSISSVKEKSNHKNYYYVITVTDISKIKENEKQLQHLAHFDQLTSLPNRTLFLSSLEKALQKSKQLSQEVAIIYIDLDGFKEINDSQGHDTGDTLLQEIGDRLRKLAPSNTTVARLGGDEFAVLQPETNKQLSRHLAESIVTQLSMSKRFETYTLDISASVGIAHYPEDGDEIMELLRKADQAMYQAKSKGKNRYQYYDSVEGERLSHRIQMMSNMNEAINDRAFYLNYQPKMDLTDNGFINVEALLRWKHPQLGQISPMEFIPIAEDSGQIINIGEQAFEQICQFIKQWDSSYQQRLKVAVNLSFKQLRTDNLANVFLSIMNSAGIKGDSLEFEITESVIMHDVEASLKVLEQLKATGATIAIDDFGTGYSSLSYLKKLPVDTLKIDQSFVSNLPASSDDSAICTAIVSMSHELGIQVVAEGVETEEQLEFLAALGCEQIQGYIIGHPVPPRQLPELILKMKAEVSP